MAKLSSHHRDGDNRRAAKTASPRERRSVIIQYAFIAVCTLTTACAASRTIGQAPVTAASQDPSPVRTDSLTYRLQRRPNEYRAYVLATYRNTTPAPVYFARCGLGAPGPMFGVRRTGADSTRRFFTDFVWACVGGVPTGTLNPGDSVTVRVPIGSFDQPTMRPPLAPGDLIGGFRIELSLCAHFEADSDRCMLLPQAQRSSNMFTVSY